MAVTAQTIVDAAKLGISIPTTDTTTYTNSECINYLNEGITIIASAGAVSYTETEISVTDESRVYDLPTGTMEVKFAYLDGQNHALELFDPRQTAQQGGLSVTGQPRFYAEENEQIILHPFPDGNYTLIVEATGTPTLVTALNDSVTLSRPYTDALRYFVQAQMLLREGDERADTYLTMWSALLENARNVDAAREARKFTGEVRQSGTPRAGFYYK